MHATVAPLDRSSTRINAAAMLGHGIDALAIANTIRDPLLVLDEQLIVRFANRAFEQHFRLPLGDTIGRVIWSLANGEWQHPDLQRLLESVLPTDARFDDFELAHRFTHIGECVLLLNGSTIAVPDTAQRWILLAMQDITERRHADIELAARRLELERFTMVASHDLQEPLRKIRTYGVLLAEECAADLSEDGQDYVRRMSSAATRMQKLIDDLLSLARTSTATTTMTRVNLATVAEEVLVDLEVAMREAEASVTIVDLPTVVADPLQMRQLMQNLLANAAKFRRKGVPLTIHLSGRPSPTKSDVHEVRVTDNGIGFDPAYARSIFEPFKRLHGRSEYAGNGIGLALCKRIVERHHGTISAESDPSTGTTFILTLTGSTHAAATTSRTWPNPRT